MLQGMDQSAFGQFVAALWEQQGWQTQVKDDDGRVFVAAQRPETGEEGLIWAIPASDGEVGGQQVQQFVSLCREYEVEESAIVTAGSMSDHAEKVASGTGVELLDGDGVEAFVKRHGLTGLVQKYGGGGGGGDGGGGSGDSPVDRLRAVGERATERAGALVGGVDVPKSRIAVIAVVVVALLAVGVLVGPSVPFLGGGDDRVSAASVSPDDSETTLEIAWNAKVTDTINPNESTDKAYHAPEGEEFVMIRMSVNNTGEASVPLEQSAFEFRTEEATYDHRKLADHEGFLGFPLGPGENYAVWTVFTVPEGTAGTLVYDQNATDVTVEVAFERDSDLPVEIKDQ